MATIGLYFKNMDRVNVNEMRGRLNELFGRLGYATDTPSRPDAPKRREPWRGGLPNGLIGLDRGELALVPVPDPGSIEGVICQLREFKGKLEEDFLHPCFEQFQSDPFVQALNAYADALAETL